MPFLTTIYFLLTTSSSAQAVSLSLSPTLTEIAIKPGISTSIKYKIENRGDPAIVNIQILPFDTNQKSPVSFSLDNSNVKLAEPFFLKNSDSLEVIVNLQVPQESAQRDYYYNFIIESQPPPSQEGTANLRAKISLKSPLLITVTGDGEVEIKPKISLFEITPKNKINLLGFKINLFNSFERVPVVLVVDNKGKNLIKQRGQINVRGPFWQSRRYEIKSENVLSESQKKISLNLSGFIFGYYKISANLSFGEGTPSIFASTSFIVLPIRITVFASAVFILLIFLIYKFKKS